MVKAALRKVLGDSTASMDELSYVTLDMGASSFLDLSNECESLSIGAAKKIVVAENCVFLAKTRTKIKTVAGDDDKPLLAFFESPDPSVDLYLLVYSDSVDEKGPYYQALLRGGVKVSPVAEFSPQQWKDFIPKYFEKRGSPIESSAIGELMDRIRGDYSLFLSEAQKLLAYENGSSVTLEDVRLLVSSPLEDDAFHLSNALTKGDIKTALSIYRDLRTQSVDPISLIRLLGNQFRFMNEVAYLKSQNANASGIAATLKCSSYRVSVTLDNLRKIHDGSLNNALDGLYQCESSVMGGRMDQDLAFSLFLANFAL
jgi:DNA polymerase III delta subunit